MNNITLIKNPEKGNKSLNGTREDSHDAELSARIAVSVILMIFIICGNLLVMLAYKKNHRLRTGTNTFLVSLAVSDFLVGSVSLPLWIFGSVNGWHDPHFPRKVYIFFICFDIFSALASMFHLTAVSIDRFIAISRPFYYQTVTARPYFISIAIAWGLALLLAALHPGLLNTLLHNLPGNLFQIYGIIVFSSGYLAPLVLISAMNIKIFRIVRKLVRRSAVPRPSQVGNDNNQFTKETTIRRRLPKERKTAITLVLITGLFFVAWLPFFIVNMLSLYCLRTCLPTNERDILVLVELTKWCHYSNSAANAVVYAFRDLEMRRTFMRLLWPCFNRNRAIGPTIFETNALRTRHNSTASATTPIEKIAHSYGQRIEIEL